MSLLLHGGTVVTSLDPVALVRADVLVVDGRVGAVEAGLAASGDTLDVSGCLVVPGNVNAHMHAYSALARGMPYRLAPPTDFLQILQRIWWRLDRALDGPSILASALTAGREALLAGTTTLVDHHASPNAIGGSLDLLAAAFADVGIRSVLAYEVSDRDGPQRAAAGLEENDRFLRRGDALPLARGLVGAHASFTLSDETLADLCSLAVAADSGLHIHVAEDALDEADAIARSGRRALHRLAAAGVLDERALIAHAVHLDEDEAASVRAAGATVAYNPRSNMNNGVGRAPLGWLGERVALGTDGIGADMFEEGRTGYLRRREEERSVGDDWPLRRLAASAGVAARAFAEPLLGRVEAGAPADLAVLDYAPPTPLEADNLAGHWLFGISAANVRDVLVGGEVVVRERRLTRVDETELTGFATEQARRLWARLETIDSHPFAPGRVAAPAGAG